MTKKKVHTTHKKASVYKYLVQAIYSDIPRTQKFHRLLIIAFKKVKKKPILNKKKYLEISCYQQNLNYYLC